MKSESIKELATALSKVKFGEIHKSKTVKVATKSGSSYNFAYAPMENIMSAIRKPLAEQGLTLTQSVSYEGVERHLGVITTLSHLSGEWQESYCPIVVKEGYTAQEMGSAIQYARRYGVNLACCLVADEDDDANIADGNEVKETKTAFATPHKPTDGAWESLSADERTWIMDLSNEVRSLLAKKDIKGACDHIDEAKLDGDQKVALWSKLADLSADRNAMKKEWESRRLKEVA